MSKFTFEQVMVLQDVFGLDTIRKLKNTGLTVEQTCSWIKEMNSKVQGEITELTNSTYSTIIVPN